MTLKSMALADASAIQIFSYKNPQGIGYLEGFSFNTKWRMSCEGALLRSPL